MRNDLDLRQTAERYSEQLTERLALIESVAWNLDSTLSALDKDSAGYRMHNAANRDGGASYISGELEAAVLAAGRVLDRFKA